jgi:hypothetical protein
MNDISHPFPAVSVSLNNMGPADQFRGRFLDHCARVERWAADILFDAGKDTSELQFLSSKLKEVHKLAKCEPSPFELPERVRSLLHEFQPFAELRVALAHGALELLAGQDGRLRWAFLVHCSPAAGWKSIVLRADEAKGINQALQRVATELTQQSLKAQA